jgi:hypothetical protein
MDKNRELAELLGLCWHEYDHWEGRKQVCRCGKGLWYFDAPVEWGNTDFTTDPGKIELLRLMMERNEDSDFLKFATENQQTYALYVLQDLIVDTTGRLAQAALEWLTAQKEEV